ncbi:hypothetical protein ZWY2020_042993 [Hordeum vulgare]|nr:hypothetical protein ZWY2020_042993 [Hordeum vulgare]
MSRAAEHGLPRPGVPQAAPTSKEQGHVRAMARIQVDAPRSTRCRKPSAMAMGSGLGRRAQEKGERERSCGWNFTTAPGPPCPPQEGSG